MKTTIVGRSALIEGPRYDLAKVLTAHEALVDLLTAHFGASTVTTDHAGAQKRIPWPVPGKALARETWTKMKEIHDVVDEPLIHQMGNITVKAYLLGKTWCVKDVETGEVRTAEGDNVSLLDPVPKVCIYGARQDDGSCRLIDGATMDAISVLIADKLRNLGLDFERSTINEAAAAGADATDVAYVTFPHAVYGAGRDWLTVRCVASDGSEIENEDLN